MSYNISTFCLTLREHSLLIDVRQKALFGLQLRRNPQEIDHICSSRIRIVKDRKSSGSLNIHPKVRSHLIAPFWRSGMSAMSILALAVCKKFAPFVSPQLILFFIELNESLPLDLLLSRIAFFFACSAQNGMCRSPDSSAKFLWHVGH